MRLMRLVRGVAFVPPAIVILAAGVWCSIAVWCRCGAVRAVAAFSDRTFPGRAQLVILLLGNLVGSVAAAVAAAVLEIGPPLPALTLMTLLAALGFARWIMIAGWRRGVDWPCDLPDALRACGVTHPVRRPGPRPDRRYCLALSLYDCGDDAAFAAAGTPAASAMAGSLAHSLRYPVDQPRGAARFGYLARDSGGSRPQDESDFTIRNGWPELVVHQL